MQSGTAVCGGGTNTAFPGRDPPIQFCERRNSPGSLPAPRPCASSTPWISRIRRFERGKPPRRRPRPCSRAPTQLETSTTSSNGTPGASSSSNSRRSDSDDCVPSICEESTASFRT